MRRWTTLVRRRDLFALAALGLLGVTRRAGAAGARIVYVQPLGAELPAADLKLVERAIRAFYVVEVKVLERVPLPRAAYYRPRNRWRAEKLIAFLERRMPSDGHRIVGLTAADISTTKDPHADWGVLGLATIGGTASVISSFRCKRGVSAERARQRLGKVAVHELGHSLGLDHCATRGCLMEDAGGKAETCDREHDLCVQSRQHLLDRGVALADGAPPWPEP